MTMPQAVEFAEAIMGNSDEAEIKALMRLGAQDYASERRKKG